MIERVNYDERKHLFFALVPVYDFNHTLTPPILKLD